MKLVLLFTSLVGTYALSYPPFLAWKFNNKPCQRFSDLPKITQAQVKGQWNIEQSSSTSRAYKCVKDKFTQQGAGMNWKRTYQDKKKPKTMIDADIPKLTNPAKVIFMNPYNDNGKGIFATLAISDNYMISYGAYSFKNSNKQCYHQLVVATRNKLTSDERKQLNADVKKAKRVTGLKLYDVPIKCN